MKKSIRVVGCIMQNDDTLLMLHRSDQEENPGLWGIPAGKVEVGETDLQAVGREVYEETGIKLHEQDFEPLGEITIEHETLDIIFPVFKTFFDQRPIIILTPSEHTDYLWMKPEAVLELPNLMKDVDVIIQSFFSVPA